MTTCLGKSCSFDLPRVPFVNCCQFMYLVISLLVLRAGCGILLYQFLIIAYLFTLDISRRNLEKFADHNARIKHVDLKMFSDCLFSLKFIDIESINNPKRDPLEIQHPKFENSKLDFIEFVHER